MTENVLSAFYRTFCLGTHKKSTISNTCFLLINFVLHDSQLTLHFL